MAIEAWNATTPRTKYARPVIGFIVLMAVLFTLFVWLGREEGG